MRTLTELSGEYLTSTTIYENVKSEFEILLMRLTEKIDGSYRLAVLIVNFDERGRVSLS